MPRFVIESKFYKDFAYHQLFTGTVATLDNWIDQTYDCIDDGDFWLVAFKTNRRPWLAVVSAEHAGLKADHQLTYVSKSGRRCVVLSLESLLDGNAAMIRDLCR